MNVLDQKAVGVAELWQCQSYWPIKGWMAPMGSTAHFSGPLLAAGAEAFPTTVSPPPGWEWTDKWAVDLCPRYGTPDAEGWYYAATFDRLNEVLKTCTGTGVASKTSLVRKRRWIRPIVCVSEEILNQIKLRSEKIIQIRCGIEQSLRDKESSLVTVVDYESNRAYVFDKSLQLATQSVLNTLSILKDLVNKLKLLKQFLLERAQMELEYSRRLEAMAQKFNGSGISSESPMKSSNRQDSHMLEDVKQQQTPQRNIGSSPTASSASRRSASPSDVSSASAIPDSSFLFFTNMSFMGKTSANRVKEFASVLAESMAADVEVLLNEAQIILKEARVGFRKNSDICRLSEGAVKNCFASIKIAHDSIVSSSLDEITKLSDELNGLKGGQSSDMQKDPRTSSTPAMASKEDFWLSIQRYRQVVRGTQEALCVLIADSMDLELQQQIMSNKAHTIFVMMLKSFHLEQSNYLTESLSVTSTICSQTVSNMIGLGKPYPTLQSPFARLTERDPDEAVTAPASGAANTEEAHSNQVINEQDYMNSTGIFAFTCLYKAPLPPCNGVVIAHEFMIAKVDDFIKSKNVLSSGIWKTVYVIATVDGYIHIIGGAKYDMPERSFSIKHCEVLPLIKDFNNVEYHDLIVEIRQITTPIMTTRLGPQPTPVHSGVFLRAEDAETVLEWVRVLNDHPVTKPNGVDEEIERETTLAMRSSLPILKGESSKISADLQQYVRMLGDSNTPTNPEDQGVLSSPTAQTQDQVTLDNSPGSGDANLVGGQSLTDEFGFATVAEGATDDPEEEDDDDEREEEEQEEEQREASTDAEGNVTDSGAGTADGGVSDGTNTDASNVKPSGARKKLAHDYSPNRSNASNAGSSNSLTTPPVKKLYGFGSQYKKGSDSWIKHVNNDDTTGSGAGGSGSTASLAKPKQIIPVADREVPLARRHSQMISQYEKGLQEEKQVLTEKVSETRGKRMKDFTLTTITPVAVAAAAVATQIDEIANNVTRDTVRSVSPVLKENNAVRRMSQKFSGPIDNIAKPSAMATAAPAVASPDSASSEPINEGYDVVSSPTTPQTYAVLSSADTTETGSDNKAV